MLCQHAEGRDTVPVGLPPRGGPLGRSRGRISASALTTYLRCPRQWLLKYQAGLQGPTRPSQILGVVLEEALCELFMLHPPNTVDGLDALRAWAQPHVEQYAQQALKRGREAWNSSLWKHDENAWEGVCLLYTSPSPRDKRQSRMPSSA